MRENNIFSKRRIKFKVTTKAAKKAVNIDNVLNRNFVTNAPNKVWVSDITYIKTKQGWVYLCIRRLCHWKNWRCNWQKNHFIHYNFYNGRNLFNNGNASYLQRDKYMGDSCNTFMQSIARLFLFGRDNGDVRLFNRDFKITI